MTMGVFPSKTDETHTKVTNPVLTCSSLNLRRAAAHEIEAPEPEEHRELPRVHTHLSALDVVQLGAPTALAEVDHADAAQRGPDVLQPNDL